MDWISQDGTTLKPAHAASNYVFTVITYMDARQIIVWLLDLLIFSPAMFRNLNLSDELPQMRS